VAALNGRQVRQDADEAEAAEYWQGNSEGLVFTTAFGTPVNDRNMARSFRAIYHNAGVGKWDLHECRHTFATLALLAGVPIEQVSRMLGHSDIRVTADTYAHVIPRHLQGAVDALDAVLAG